VSVPPFTPADAIARGWSIIPVNLNKKPYWDLLPKGPDGKPIWKPFQTRLTTPDELASWIRANPPAFAIATGAFSHVVTFDFDGDKGVELAQKWGIRPHRRTGSGGLHWDVQHPGFYVPTLNGKSKEELGTRWPGLDVKGDGGYAIAFGRNASGKYEWMRPPGPDDGDQVPAEVWDFLRHYRKQTQPQPSEETRNGNGRVRQPPEPERVDPKLLIRRALDQVATNGREVSGFWLAQQLRDNGYTKAEAHSEMRNYRSRTPDTNTKGQREAYTEAEMEGSLNRAYEQAAREPWERRSAARETTVQKGNVAPKIAPPPEEEKTEGAAAAKPSGGEDRSWRKKLIVNKQGKACPLLANALTPLRGAAGWQDVLAYSEFDAGIYVRKTPPIGPVSGEWSDQEDRLTVEWLQHRGIHVGLDVTGQAIQTCAREHSFHPVRDHLSSLKPWDRVKRLDTWLLKYACVAADPDDSEDDQHKFLTYCKAVARRWMISAVARIFKPGCKADHILILEEPQGIGKSTTAKILGGDWYCDELPEIGSKDASLQVRGTWILELSELDVLSRAEAGRIKSFISRSTDKYRPPYARRPAEFPRQCIFIGTTNSGSYLKDETGGRRFWPVKCAGNIQLDKLAEVRDQLWAEAVVAFKAGEAWYLESSELVQQAQQEQAERYEGDAWDPLILEWAADRLIAGADSVSVAEALEMCLSKKRDTWVRSDEMRVGRCLTSAKWERYRDRKKNMEWRYRPPRYRESDNVPTY
jgi:predicted P-loop ATPase